MTTTVVGMMATTIDEDDGDDFEENLTHSDGFQRGIMHAMLGNRPHLTC